MNAPKAVYSLSFLLAASLGLGLGACQETEMRADRVCKRHCSQVEDCKSSDYDTCVDNCIEAFGECDSEVDGDMALDRLAECRNEECSDVLACEADAWFECKI
jgi:hypothetical protein